LRYNIIDTVSSSATNARRLFEDIWETMVIAMEEVTSISITKDDKIKNYVKESFMDVVSRFYFEILSTALLNTDFVFYY
jgi:hypothetical protein